MKSTKSLVEQNLKSLLKLKPNNMSKEAFLTMIVSDQIYSLMLREALVSREKTIEGRTRNTLGIMASTPHFSGSKMQVYLSEGSTSRLIAQEPNELEKQLEEDTKRVLKLELDGFGKLLIEPTQKLNDYELFLLKQYVDTLTNAGYFQDQLEREVNSELEKGEKGLSLILLDLDGFKNYNDKFSSHTIGDQVLKEIAYILKSMLTRKRDVVCRSGIGDEFGIILPRTKFENAIEKAESIRHLIDNTHFNGEEIAGKLTISGGVCHTSYAPDSKKLYERTDKALYVAKQTKNKIVPYHPNL